MGACASRFKILKDSGDAQPLPVTKEEEEEEAAAVVVEEEVKDKDVGVVADDEANHQSLGQMLIQENEGEECLVKNDSKFKASEELKPRENEALESIQAAEEAEKTEGKPIQISNLETVEDKTVVEFEGNEDSATEKKPEAKKIEENE